MANFNAEPYYDDYDEEKKFLKILYRPGYAVQARELNQLQSILQNQISRVGDHLFKEGTMVIPGQAGFDNNLSYVKLTPSVGASSTDGFLEGLVGQIVVGQTTGVRAKVLTYTKKTSSDPSMIYVKYLNSGTNGTTKTFAASETLQSEDSGVTVIVASGTPTGVGSGATIQRGVFYVKKNFILVDTQTIVLSKTSKTPTAKVCLQIVEDIVTPEEDETLLDNAAGSNNYSAPGAHRYKISLNLVQKSYEFTSGEGTDFIEILRLKNGNIEYLVDRTDYNVLMETIARRTYDESGNYTVKNFPISVKHYRSNNRGTYVPSKPYLANDIVTHTSNSVTTYYRALNSALSDANTTPNQSATTGFVKWQKINSPTYNNGVYSANSAYTTVAEHQADEAKLALGLGAGKAYIFGYEVEQKALRYTPVKKARAIQSYQDVRFPTDLGQYVIVKNINYFPDVSTFPTVNLYENFTLTPGVSAGALRGTARVRAIEHHSGVIGTTTAEYKVFLFNISMNTIPGTSRKYSITNFVKQLVIPGTNTANTFTADMSVEAVATSGTVVCKGKTVAGTGTAFLSEYEVGEWVYINSTYARVESITSNTLMTVSTSVSGTSSVSIDGTNASIVNVSTDTITAASHGFTTGTEVTYDSGSVTTSSANSISSDASTGIITVPSTTGLVVGKSVKFGSSFAGITSGTAYYVKTIPNGTTFTISDTSGGATKTLSPEVTTKATAIAPSSDLITVDSVASFTVNDKIVFTGTTYGGLVSGTAYYIKTIDTNNKQITVSATSGGATLDITAVTTTATATAVDDWITVGSTSGMQVNDTVTLSGTAFGGLTATTYYILNVDTTNKKIKLSSTLGGTAVDTSAATGTMTVALSTVRVNLSVSLPVVTTTSSLTFEAGAIGGLVDGDTYYINAEGSANAFVLYRTKGEAETSATTGKINLTAVSSNGTAHSFIRNPSSGVAIEKSYRPLVNAGTASLIYNMPSDYINKVSDVRYTAVRTFTTQVDQGNISLICSAPYQFDNPNINGYYIIVDQTTGAVITPTGVTRSNNNLSITFTVNSALNGHNVIVQSTLAVSAQTPKIKTLKTSTRTITSKTIGESTVIYTGKADCIRITGIKMSTGTWATPNTTYTTDITSRYDFKVNQTESYYGISYIQLKSGQTKPTAPFIIEFEYYEHSGTSDFFSVQSYTGVPYEAIPVYNGKSLRDCIDFRPKVSDNTTGAVVFTDDETLMSKYSYDMTMDYSFYLTKKCKVFMDRAGKVTITEGASAEYNPQEAPDISDSMLLYKFDLAPYTENTDSSSVKIEAVDNKRYTMSDIGKLEKRIQNLEYYTSLSLLESETQSLSVKDADGLEKFKNGFVVDNFTGHNVGDTTNPDYINSIDFESKVLRPFFTKDQVDFVEVASSQSERLARNYTIGNKNGKGNGKYITLPYDEVSYVSQLRSSTTEKVNPFSYFTFLGQMTITPSQDMWFEVKRRPDLVVESKEGNYNTIKNLAEKAGVLGTVWNAWTYNWSGKSEKVKSNNVYGAGTYYQANSEVAAFYANGGGWRGARASNSFSITTVAVSVPRSRTGLETYVKEVFDDRVLEDKILSSTILPYMRSRNLVVQTRGLKAETVFYPFFAGKDVSAYCTPAEMILFTARSGKSSTFDTEARAGNKYSEDARVFRGETPDLSISVGDVLVEYDSAGTTPTGVTGVVVGWEKYEAGPNAGKFAVWVVNRRYPGNATDIKFKANNVIKGTISEAEGTIVSFTAQRQGSALMTSRQGGLFFTFNVPNNNTIKFNTGTNELTLLDVSTFDKKNSTSSASKGFTASGVYQERQNQIQRIRNGEIATKQVTQDDTYVANETRYSNDPGWYDPLAQTFLITETNGVFVTSIDLFFYKKDPSVPVNVEIREVVNGYPGKNVLTTSKASIPASQIVVSNNASLATNVKFPSPTYLNGNTEYAIILTSDSDLPEVWVAQMGQIDKENGAQIGAQPYMGVFFKSQNASTWTADQMIDLKFQLYKAKFATNTIGSVAFENTIIKDAELEDNPIHFTAGSKKIRVFHDNHGMNTDSVVALKAVPPVAIGEIYCSKTSTTVTGVGTKFSSVNAIQPGAILYRQDGRIIGEVNSVTNDTTIVLKANALSNYGVAGDTEPFRFMNPLAGVSPSDIFKIDANGNPVTHDIDSVELDSYTITLGASADTPNITGTAGGSGILASRDIPYDLFNPLINVENYAGTDTAFYYQGVTGKSMDGSQTPYKTFSDAGLVYSNTFPIVPGEDHYMPVPMTIASKENAAAKSLNLSTLSALRNSAVITVDMVTTNEDLSPIINVENVSVTYVSNKTNSPSSSMNVNPIDYTTIISDETGIVFDGTNTATVQDLDLQDNIASLVSGQYITISGSSVTQNNNTWYVTDVDPAGKWFKVSGNLSAKAASDTITVVSLDRYFTERTPVGSSSINKYVTRKMRFANPCTSIKILFDASVPPAANVGVYYKLNPTGTDTDFNFVEYETARASVPADLKNEEGAFLENEIDLTDLPSFDAITVKLVMTSTDSTQVPMIKDLRIIALA